MVERAFMKKITTIKEESMEMTERSDLEEEELERKL